ncbi:MAG: HD domain-containing protein [Lachnospiraceae bacterium]|nr:HD domain-containing protein [Lachnospiraceae bacterium]
MKYIEDLREGLNIRSIYLCKGKRSAETRGGKPYDNVILQDKTGTLDGKVWDPNSHGIAEYDEKDFIEVVGDVISYNNSLQLNIKQIRKVSENEYDLLDYLPSTDKDVEEMYQELCGFIKGIENDYLRQIAEFYFVKDASFVKKFKEHSAAKSVHHSFAGGLLEHTVNILRLCCYFADNYPVVNRSLLYAGALFHDIGKTRELSDFPDNDYTDEGQLIGHIIIGVEMITEAVQNTPGFPEVLANELKHCVLAHHGELEFGSPKKPALIEAVVLNLADNADSKLQILIELFHEKQGNDWLGYNRLFETNLRRTTV